jgi:hypothetical protein
MIKWTRPEDGLPKVWAGERVAVIVIERPQATLPLQAYLVVLTATEDGWRSDDPTYNGYTPEDGAFWVTEHDLCGFARVLNPELFVG